EEPAAIRPGELAVTPGKVERDRSAGSVQWVGDSNRLRELLQHGLQPLDERQGCLVNFQFLVIE
ncbi:MAG: hypothetical protein JXQ71_00070, partial [Verrucomicrobia bacterium]|nr:hypothetical protein [Verrucomicrobiota bacterium]